MTTITCSIRAKALPRSMPIAIALGALACTSVQAQTENPAEITIAAKTEKVLRHGPAVAAPERRVSVTATVKADPDTLTTPEGVAQLKESVRDAARKVCDAADPSAPPGTGTECVHNAVKAAKPQVDAAIKLARSSAAPPIG